MSNSTNTAPRNAGGMTGDVDALATQLAPSELGELARSGSFVEPGSLRTRDDLRGFLRSYAVAALIPRDLPVICRAFNHASRGETRELIALDQGLQAEPGAVPFSRASGQVGRGQLRRLRPARDQRVVQRYLAAVDAGEAKGWHTIVYGMALAFYSIPLRQGVVHYALQTLNGFIESAAGPLRLTQAECGTLLDEGMEGVPDAVETILRRDMGSTFSVI